MRASRGGCARVCGCNSDLVPRPLEVKADGLMRQEENGSRQGDALVHHSSPSPPPSVSPARVRQARRHVAARSSSRRSKERKGGGGAGKRKRPMGVKNGRGM